MLKYSSSLKPPLLIGLFQPPHLGQADLVNYIHSINFSSKPEGGRNPVFVAVGGILVVQL